LRLKAVRRLWSRGSRTLPFSIEADQQGFPTATAGATFVQTPIMPERLGRRFVALVVLAGALTGAWFGLIRPATRNAAKDAVRDYTPVVITATTLPGAPVTTQATTSETTIPVVTVPDAGDPFMTTLRVASALGADPTVSQATFDVPPGKDLHITDLILENVANDTGLATVLKNEVFLTSWNLFRSATSHDPVQPFTPFLLESGTTLTFKVSCKGVGQDSADVFDDEPADDVGKCIERLLISGTLVSSGS
jgi:hypothetical protein